MTRVRICLLLVSLFAVGVSVAGLFASPDPECCGDSTGCSAGQTCCDAAGLGLPGCGQPDRDNYCRARCVPLGSGF